MDRSYFAPLVNKPIVITGPGTYRTRSGEAVEVHISSMEHAFACRGTYASGAMDFWHRSGRIYAHVESADDIVAAIPKTYRLYGMDFAIVAEHPDTEQGITQANAFMEANRNTGLLAVDDGRIILAALTDKGVKP